MRGYLPFLTPIEPSLEPAPPRLSGWKVVRAVVIGALVLPAMLLVAENVFINTGLRVLVNPQPERALITWTWAWTFWPGSVRASGLKIRVQDPATQWTLSVDEASGVIDLFKLKDHVFAGRDLHGSGATVRARVRRETAPAAGDHSSAPPIPGLTNPPDPSPEALYGEGARPYRIELEGLEVDHLRELWIEDYRFVGDAHLAGSLELLAGAWLSAPALSLGITSGDVTIGERPTLRNVSGEVDLSVAGINPVEHLGAEILQYITGRLKLQADVEDLHFLSFYLRKAPWLDIAEGQGTLAVDVSIDDGRLVDGSQFGIDCTDLSARFLTHTVTGTGQVRFAVAPDAGPSEARLTVSFLDYTVDREGATSPLVAGTGLQVTARTADISLAEPFEHLSVTLDIPEATIPDVAVYNAYLPQDLGLRLVRGAGKIRGNMQATTDGGLATGDLFLDADAVEARMDDIRLTGRVALQAHLVEGDLVAGRYDVSGSGLSLRRVALVGATNSRKGKDDSTGWWGTVDVKRAVVNVGAPTFLDTSLGVRFRDTVPFVTMVARTTDLPPWIRGLLVVEDLSGSAHVLLGDDSLYLQAFSLRGGRYEVHSELRRTKTKVRGHLYARYGILDLGVALNGKESFVHPLNARAWFDAQPSP